MKDFLSALLQYVTGSLKDSELPVRRIAMGAGGVVVAVFLGWMIFGTSAEDLLDAQDLNEKQIRKIATTLLLSEDPAMRERATARIISAGNKSVPVLKELSLDVGKPRLSEAALCILLNLSRDTAVAVIETLMANPDAEVRRMALRCAGSCDDPKTAAILSKALSDPDTGVRLAATNGLAAQKTRAGVSNLEKALKDENPTVRRHAARALQNLTGKDYSERARSPK